jgi:hypothetical protein
MPKNTDVLPDFTPGEITFPPIPLFAYKGDLTTETASGLGRAEVLFMLDVMLFIRHFEEMIVTLKRGKFEPLARYKFIGATHLSIG